MVISGAMSPYVYITVEQLVSIAESNLNPTTWKHVNYFSPPGALVGYNNAGIVEELAKV